MFRVLIFLAVSLTAAAQGTPPTADSVTPNSGSGTSRMFTFHYSSVNGYPYIKSVFALVNGSLSSHNGCRIEYQQAANRLYLLNDAGTTSLGPLTPGIAGTVSNSQCTLDAGASSLIGSGNTLSLTVSLKFASIFAGLKTLYGEAVDNGQLNSGWITLGSWTTGTPLSAPPTADSVTPHWGAGQGQSFTFQYSSANGSSYLNFVYGLLNASLSSHNGCRIQYQPSTNRLYLLDDAGTTSLGPLTPGVAGSESNSQCTIDASASSVSAAGNTLSVTVALTFTPAFAGVKKLYGDALDNGNLNSGWQSLGAWNTAAPQNTAPTADSVTPNSGASASHAFTF